MAIAEMTIRREPGRPFLVIVLITLREIEGAVSNESDFGY
jgi:hypothetical protein